MKHTNETDLSSLTYYEVQDRKPNRKSWWTHAEATDEAMARRTMAKWQSLWPDRQFRILKFTAEVLK